LHSTISNVDISRGESLFSKYGSNVRRIIGILKDPEEEEATYDLDVKSEAAEIAKDFSTILLRLERLDFKSKLSSDICCETEQSGAATAGFDHPNAISLQDSSHGCVPPSGGSTTSDFHDAHCAPIPWYRCRVVVRNYAHVRLSDPTRPPIQTHICSVSNPPSIPAPKAVLAGSNALRKIQPPFDFYWREPIFEGIDGLIRVGNTVRVLQYTTFSSHRSATKGLEEIRKIMNYIRGVDWHFDIVGPDLYIAKSARDSHKLTGRRAKTPIYASPLQIDILDKQMLERMLNEVNTYYLRMQKK